jgi:hypothetical protein
MQIMVSGFILTTLAVMPGVFFYILNKNYPNLWKPSKKQQIGSLYLGVRDNSKWAALAYAPIFMIRRSFFILLTFLAIE